MSVTYPDTAFPPFHQLLQSVRQRRLEALKAHFPPRYATFLDDHALAFALYVLIAPLVWSAIAGIPLFFATVPQLRQTHPWFVQFVLASVPVMLLPLVPALLSFVLKRLWDRSHPGHPFGCPLKRREATQGVLEPASVAREALKVQAKIARNAWAGRIASEAGYRTVDAFEHARRQYVDGLDALSVDLADPRRHWVAEERILTRVRVPMVPDAEPREVSLEDRYAELVHRCAPAFSR